MATIEKNQKKKLMNRIIDSIRKIDISTLIKIARILNIPVQTDLIKKFNKTEDKNL
jgi:hypothetical protein